MTPILLSIATNSVPFAMAKTGAPADPIGLSTRLGRFMKALLLGDSPTAGRVNYGDISACLGYVHQAAVGQYHDLVADVLRAEDRRDGGIDSGGCEQRHVVADLVDGASRLPGVPLVLRADVESVAVEKLQRNGAVIGRKYVLQQLPGAVDELGLVGICPPSSEKNVAVLCAEPLHQRSW